jgi:hypothetical protein
MPEEKILGWEEAIAKILSEVTTMKKDKTKTMSDLDDHEVGTLALLETMGNDLKVKEINHFVDNFCQFRVSRFRLGRRELGGIITFAGLGEERRGGRFKSIKDLFAGLR